tara:strand:+ start:335 stop:709 length:375 start_codon:yes stop_codon:yes gene_type:complete
MLSLFKVSGTSMEPEFFSGDLILVVKRHLKAPKKNDVVIANLKGINLVIKRVGYLKDNCVILKSDNVKNISSVCGRDIPINEIVGVVIFNFKYILASGLLRKLICFIYKSNKIFQVKKERITSP